MSILCLLYVNELDVERFLGFVDTSEIQDAESLCYSIIEYLKFYQLDKIKIDVESYCGMMMLISC